jgi:hypothetical protein
MNDNTLLGTQNVTQNVTHEQKVWTKVLCNTLLLPLFMNRDGNTLFTYKVASMNDEMSYKALKYHPPPIYTYAFILIRTNLQYTTSMPYFFEVHTHIQLVCEL